MLVLRPRLHRHVLRAAVAAVALPLVLVACGDDDGSGGDTTTTQPSGEAITEAGFHFQDSSVPPEYHRSWTLTVTEGQAYVVVDSYGDVVGEDTVEVPDGVWEDLRAGVAALEGDEADADDDGCAGGTGAEVWAREGDVELFQMDASVCGGGDGDADIVDRWQEPFEPVLELFDMEALTAPSE